MRSIVTRDGAVYSTPIFLPVFEVGNPYISMELLKGSFPTRGLMTNAYFLYKKREFRSQVVEHGIKKFIGFESLVVTDSGAFQQFSGPLYLSNSKIISFQQEIDADIISPLDLITSPGDTRTTASKKLATTLKRIKEGAPLADRTILIGVQQGGRFLDLRAHALRELMKLGSEYIALGSLVPFFNRNHSIEFIGTIIKQAREIVPPDIPIHLYGGGDPLELPFYIAMGCDVFDSSSFVHYAVGGWYMTPYGAFKDSELLESSGYLCDCPHCRTAGPDIWEDARALACHNLWVILYVVEQSRRMVEENALLDHLDHVAGEHQRWFPQSRLAESWKALGRGRGSP